MREVCLNIAQILWLRTMSPPSSHLAFMEKREQRTTYFCPSIVGVLNKSDTVPPGDTGKVSVSVGDGGLVAVRTASTTAGLG